MAAMKLESKINNIDFYFYSLNHKFEEKKSVLAHLAQWTV